MHISEGVLSWQVLSAGGVITAAGTAIGLKKLDYGKIATAGLLAAAFLVASLIHINVGPASVHLVFNGIVGLLMGISAFPVILIALLLQAIFFQFGGITTLGVNTANMAIPAILCAFLFRRMIKKGSNFSSLSGAFACGFFSIFFSGIMLAFSLIFTEKNFFETAMLIIVSHLPIMVIEGIVTAFCIAFLKKVKPEMLSIFIIPFLLGSILFFTPATSYAHRVNVFAWEEDGKIHTQSKFSGGKKVSGGVIEVYDMNGKKLLSGKTDANGSFVFKSPDRTSPEMEIILIAGMGHKASWKFYSEETDAPEDNSNNTKPESIFYSLGIIALLTSLGIYFSKRRKKYDR